MHPVLELLYTILVMVYYTLESLVLFCVPKSFRKGKDITGETALVTGAGSGIGRLIAIRLARLGAKVVLWDVNKAGLDGTKSVIEKEGGEVRSFICDVSDRTKVYEIAEQVRQEIGDVTIIINNAGIVNGKWLLETADEKIAKVMDVNVTAHFWILKAFLPHMIETNHGQIVTISSIAGRSASPRLVDYCASKFAATGLHEALSRELRLLGKDGIYVTNVCPFFIKTGMFEGVEIKNPWLPLVLPLLEPEYVADKVVEATIFNEYEILIPRSFYFLGPLAAILPRKAMIAAEDFLGVSEFMSNFVGREGSKQPISGKL
jgi:all-trans-retinol dehydrogenase (NAD+)